MNLGWTVMLALQLLLVFGNVSSSEWAIIRNGRPSPPTAPFNEVVFEKHPSISGKHVDNSGLAYLIRYAGSPGSSFYETFGQSYINPDGLICARFVNADGTVFSECDGFRLLSNQQPDRKDFFLVRPEEVEQYQQVPTPEISVVQFLNQQAVVMHDPEENSSFFGTLRHKNGRQEAVGVNYKGITLTYTGATLLSGDYILLIAKRNYLGGQ